MKKLVFLLLLFAPLASLCQFNYMRAGGMKQLIPYVRDFDFNELRPDVDFAMLEGEELYFPRRNELRPNVFDTIDPIRCMYRPEDIRQRIIFHDRIKLPYSVVEDQFFKIIRCYDTANTGPICFINFELEAADGQRWNWTVPSREVVESEVHFKGYLQNIKQRYVHQFLYGRFDEAVPNYIFNLLTDKILPFKEDQRFYVTGLTFLYTKYKPCAQPVLLARSDTGDTVAIGLGNSSTLEKEIPQLHHFMDDSTYRVAVARYNRQVDSLDDRYLRHLQDAEADQEKLVKGLVKRYGKTTTDILLRHEVRLGMSTDMCEIAWGQPLVKLYSITTAGKVETWRYAYRQWLRFTNGALSSYSE